MAVIKENMTADDIEKQILELKEIAEARRKEETMKKVPKRKVEEIDFDDLFDREDHKLDEVLDILHKVTGPRPGPQSRDPQPSTAGQAQQPGDSAQSEEAAVRHVGQAEYEAKKFNLLKWVGIGIAIVLIAAVALYFLG